jgi:hypothetical protein
MAFNVDDYVIKFKQVFGAPIDNFMLDKDPDNSDSPYAWPAGLGRWDTESAVEDQYGGELSVSERAELSDELNNQSEEWFKEAEFYGHRGD